MLTFCINQYNILQPTHKNTQTHTVCVRVRVRVHVMMMNVTMKSLKHWKRMKFNVLLKVSYIVYINNLIE